MESDAGSRSEADFEIAEEDGEEEKKDTRLCPPFKGDMIAGRLAGPKPQERGISKATGTWLNAKKKIMFPTDGRPVSPLESSLLPAALIF